MTVPWPGTMRGPSRPETSTVPLAAGHLDATGRSGPVRSVAATTGGTHQGRVNRRVIAGAAGSALPGAPAFRTGRDLGVFAGQAPAGSACG
jgi:hypothetical protein